MSQIIRRGCKLFPNYPGGILIKFLYSLLLLTVLFSVSILKASPEEKSIHQQEWEYYIQFEKEISPSDVIPDIIPLDRSVSTSRWLKRDVFGYLPYWERSSAPQYFQYHLLSQIAVFGWTVNPYGDLTQPSGWPSDWANMINNAHKYGVKVIMCVIEFDAEEMHILITDSLNTRNFIGNVIHEIESYNLDGVNIDFEAPRNEDRGHVMNTFMRQLTDSVHTRLGTEYEVSFAGPAVNWSDRWDLSGLADACDYVFIMGYSFWGSWSTTAGPSAPLIGGSRNITTTVQTDYGDADPQKLILGVPYYGNRWQTINRAEGAASVNYIGSLFYRSAKDLFTTHGKLWSETYQVPWNSYYSDEKWYQFWCDDAQSLGLKYNLADIHNLRGTGMWALGYDGSNMDFWNLLAERYYVFPDEECLVAFDGSLEIFNTHPTYSGSTRGISVDSYVVYDSLDALTGFGSGQWVIKDDPEADTDWKVRILANRGDKFQNRGLAPDGRLILYMKTHTSPGKTIALAMDDMAGGMEISPSLEINGDGNWHEYRFDFQGDGWTSFFNGNGVLDGPVVSLDAIMLFSPEQDEEWILNIDDLYYERYPSGNLAGQPVRFELLQNHPNPFNGETSIPYIIEQPGHVVLNVYDIQGRFVEQLVNTWHIPGRYTTVFSSANHTSAVYIYQLTSGKMHSSGKMTILK